MAGHVFISYGRDDKPYVEQLADVLTAADVPVWFDDHLTLGERYGRTIERQIDTCAVFVVVMTSTARESEWVDNELAWALRRDKPLFPILLRGEPFLRIIMRPWEDLTNGSMPDLGWIEKLRENIGPPQVDPFEGNLLHTIQAHPGQVLSVAFAAGDSDLVATAGTDNSVRVWDTTTGANRLTIPDATWPVAFSSDGGIIATGSSTFAVQLWTNSGQHLRTIAQHDDTILGIAISPDGSGLATGSKDKTEKLWDLATGELRHTLGGRVDPGSPLVFSPDGEWLIAPNTAGSTSASLWDARTGQLMKTLSGHTQPVRDVTVSWDGRFVATGSDDRSARVWEVSSGKQVHRLNLHTKPVRAVAFAPKGQRVATGSADRSIRLWDGGSGLHVKKVTGGAGGICDLAYSPDGITLASGSGDGALRLWHA
jgi:WD40 repeat protein